MDYFRPTFGVEPTNKYDKAKQDLIKAMNSVRELTNQEQRMLAMGTFWSG